MPASKINFYYNKLFCEITRLNPIYIGMALSIEFTYYTKSDKLLRYSRLKEIFENKQFYCFNIDNEIGKDYLDFNDYLLYNYLNSYKNINERIGRKVNNNLVLNNESSNNSSEITSEIKWNPFPNKNCYSLNERDCYGDFIFISKNDLVKLIKNMQISNIKENVLKNTSNKTQNCISYDDYDIGINSFINNCNN